MLTSSKLKSFDLNRNASLEQFIPNVSSRKSIKNITIADNNNGDDHDNDDHNHNDENNDFKDMAYFF